METIILAGGFGKRIMPLTNYMPKPLLPVANIPALDYVVSQALRAGTSKITLTLGYKAEQIVQHIAGYLDFKCNHIIESQPLGSAGGVKQIAPKGNFYVLSGDCISDVDLLAMKKVHEQTNALLTIAVKQVDDLDGFGRVEADGSKLTALYEKDSVDIGRSGTANMGIYIVNEKVLDYICGTSDFAKDLVPRLLESNQRISVYQHCGYWNDIGNIESYISANIDMMQLRYKMCVRHVAHRNMIRTQRSLVDKSAIVSGDISCCIIGCNAVICSSASIKHSVILDGAIVVGKHENAIIGNEFICNQTSGCVNLLKLQKKAK